MATDLEARVGALESAKQSNKEDHTAMIKTAMETRDGVEILRKDVSSMKTDMWMLGKRVENLEDAVTVLKTDVAVLKTDVGVMKTDMVSVKTDMSWVKRAVGALLHHNGVAIDQE